MKEKMLRLIAKYNIELDLFSTDITHTALDWSFLTAESSPFAKSEESFDFTATSLLEIFLFPDAYRLEPRSHRKGGPRWVVC